MRAPARLRGRCRRGPRPAWSCRSSDCGCEPANCAFQPSPVRLRGRPTPAVTRPAHSISAMVCSAITGPATARMLVTTTPGFSSAGLPRQASTPAEYTATQRTFFAAASTGHRRPRCRRRRSHPHRPPASPSPSGSHHHELHPGRRRPESARAGQPRMHDLLRRASSPACRATRSGFP